VVQKASGGKRFDHFNGKPSQFPNALTLTIKACWGQPGILAIVSPTARIPIGAPVSPQPVTRLPPLTWERTFGGAQNDFVHAVAVTADGGYIVAGTTESKGAGGMDAWVLKLDAYGRLEWERIFGGVQNDLACGIAVTVDGGYIVAGTTESKGAGGTDGWVLKLDAHGQLEWERTFGGARRDHLCRIAATADRGYIVASYTFSNSKSTPCVMKALSHKRL